MSKSCQKVVKKLSKVVKNLSKSCQKVVKKLSKIVKRCQKVVKQLSKSCQKVVTKVVTIGHTLKPKTPKTGKFEKRIDQESTRNGLMMKKRGIRRLDATSSHLGIIRQCLKMSLIKFPMQLL
jgi:hypothetical protein